MSTPMKPERVEVGMRFATKYEPFTVLRYGSETDWLVKWDDARQLLIGNPEDSGGDEGETFAGYCAEFEATLVAPAPATPGTATVTPEPTVEHGQRRVWNAGDPPWTVHARSDGRFQARYDSGQLGVEIPGPAMYRESRLLEAAPASKPPASPVYGRMVGELRAPDGTPRTALEAIRAKREPEPWLPSVDEWDLLPDAWPR
jgi:hypothetical protein